jgi:hypothetical protein
MRILKYTQFLNEGKRFIVKSPDSDQEYYVKVPDTKQHEIIRLEKNSEQVSRWIRELGDDIKLNAKRIRYMNDRNLLATSILYRLLKGNKITEAEYEFLTEVTYDNLKAAGIALIASPVIPGGMYTLPFLFKIANEKGIDIYPSVWKLIKSEHPELRELPSYSKKLKKKEDLEKAINRYSKIYRNTDRAKELEERIKNIDNYLSNYGN